jgi:hypothetical protein
VNPYFRYADPAAAATEDRIRALVNRNQLSRGAQDAAMLQVPQMPAEDIQVSAPDLPPPPMEMPPASMMGEVPGVGMSRFDAARQAKREAYEFEMARRKQAFESGRQAKREAYEARKSMGPSFGAQLAGEPRNPAR